MLGHRLLAIPHKGTYLDRDTRKLIRIMETIDYKLTNANNDHHQSL